MNEYVSGTPKSDVFLFFMYRYQVLASAMQEQDPEKRFFPIQGRDLQTERKSLIKIKIVHKPKEQAKK